MNDLTLEEAAARANVSRNTLMQWTKEPGFPIIVYSARLKRIPVDMFDAWRKAKISVTTSSQAVSGAVSEKYQVIEKKVTGTW